MSVESVDGGAGLERLVDELAARASAATGDAAPRLLRRQLRPVIAELAADGWRPSALAELVDEAVRRAERYRASNRAAYCAKTVAGLVAEGWRPRRDPGERPPRGARAAATPDEPYGRAEPEGAPAAVVPAAVVPAAGDDSATAVPTPTGERAATLASGQVIAPAQLWSAVLADAAIRRAAPETVTQWRTHPLTILSDDEFLFVPPPGGAIMARRLHPDLVRALAAIVGRPVTLLFDRPGPRAG